MKNIMPIRFKKFFSISREVLHFIFFYHNPAKQLYFLHIKKTGGTSVRKFLERQFHLKDILPPMNLPVLANLSEEEVKQLKFVSGHFDITYKKRYGLNPTLLTVLRDPIDRVVSEFYYWKHPFNIDDDPRKPKNINLLTLESFVNNSDFANIQTKSLANGLTEGARATLKQAVHTLNSTAWFGLTEYSKQSMDMLTYLFGWRPTSFDQRIHTNEKRPTLEQIPAETLTKIGKANELDVALYKEAKRIFRYKYLAFLLVLLGFSTTIKVKDLGYDKVRELLQPHLLKRYYKKTSSIPRVTELIYTFDQPLSGEYWTRSEGQQNQTESMWRWTTAENATIDFPLRREIPLLLKFRVKKIVGDNLAVFIDGTTKKLEKIDFDNEERATYSCIIAPNTNWRDRLTTVTFHCENLQTRERPNVQETDKRKIGVAIDLIEISPLL